MDSFSLTFSHQNFYELLDILNAGTSGRIHLGDITVAVEVDRDITTFHIESDYYGAFIKRVITHTLIRDMEMIIADNRARLLISMKY